MWKFLPTGKMDFTQGESLFYVTFILTVKLPTENTLEYIKENKRIIHDIPSDGCTWEVAKQLNIVGLIFGPLGQRSKEMVKSGNHSSRWAHLVVQSRSQGNTYGCDYFQWCIDSRDRFVIRFFSHQLCKTRRGVIQRLFIPAKSKQELSKHTLNIPTVPSLGEKWRTG